MKWFVPVLAVLALQGAGTAAPAAAPRPRPLGPGFQKMDRFVGTWFFNWFCGGADWANGSPWQPLKGFETWNCHTTEWVKEQFTDMKKAGIDVVGIVYTVNRELDGMGGHHFLHMTTIFQAAKEMADAAPKIFMFFDTAILPGYYRQKHGKRLDVSSPEGQKFFLQSIWDWHDEAFAVMGRPEGDQCLARIDGRPMVSFWHSGDMDGVSERIIDALKLDFLKRYRVQPYIVCHPNDWRNLKNVDEITLMLGPPTHFHMPDPQGGHDIWGRPTINVTPGFWNPGDNPHYLPRDGGKHYVQAWENVLRRGKRAFHLYIDTWNETGEGSGIFQGKPLTYTAQNLGPKGDWKLPRTDTWGESPTFYIDTTAKYAKAWKAMPR